MEIQGIVQSVRFYHPESGRVILRLETEKGEVIVIGKALTQMHPGWQVIAQGTFYEHPQFGRQFQASEHVHTVLPKTDEGLKKLLSSGWVKGIGKVWASKLVEHFGTDLLRVLRETPERCAEIPGLTLKRQTELLETIGQKLAEYEVISHLSSLGLGQVRIHGLIRKYGLGVSEILRLRPYQIYRENRGFGFRLADSMAQRQGLDPHQPMRLLAGITHLLEEASQQGHCYLTFDGAHEQLEGLLQIPISRETLKELIEQDGALALSEGLVFLSELFGAERRIASEIQRLAGDLSKEHIQRAHASFHHLLASFAVELSAEQMQAIEVLLGVRCGVLTGGPGVGKTTVIRALLRTFEQLGKRVALSAPTGRASKRLRETTKRPAQTVHRWLKIDPQSRDPVYHAHHPLPVDVFILDEISMVDVLLMEKLLVALRTGAQLILVGDPDQLPSVGPGAILADMMHSGRLPVLRLTTIFRQARFSRIVYNAHRICEGKLPSQTAGDFTWIQTSSSEETASEVCRAYCELTAVDRLRQAQVLTAMHRGHIGTRSLNQNLKALLNPSEQPYAVGDKVIQMRNNYDKEVFNGDVGWIMQMHPSHWVLEMDDGREVLYDREAQYDLQLAYATSIHKSQGSEYPWVFVCLASEQFVLLNRNLLYTAVTRAQKHLVLIAPIKAVAMAVRNRDSSIRHTRLRTYLEHLSL